MFYGVYGCECNKVITRYENMSKILSLKSIWSGIYRREFLEENHIYFLETPGASYQDTSFWFKVCITEERGCFTEKAYVNYRIDNGGSSVKSQEKVYCVCGEMEECKRYLLESNLDIGSIYPYYVMNKKNVYLWNLERILPDYREEFINKISGELQVERFNPYMQKMGLSEWKKAGLPEWRVDELAYLVDFKKEYLRYINKDYILITMQNIKKFLDEIRNEERIYIYGAGKVGLGLSKYITDNEVFCMIQYIVTINERKKFCNILEINNENIDINQKIIISVVDQYARREMIIKAMNRGFKLVYLVNDDMIHFLRNYGVKVS